MGSEWLGRHQASLFGTVQGNASVVALTLSSALLRLRAAFYFTSGCSAAVCSRFKTCASSNPWRVEAYPVPESAVVKGVCTVAKVARLLFLAQNRRPPLRPAGCAVFTGA